MRRQPLSRDPQARPKCKAGDPIGPPASVMLSSACVWRFRFFEARLGLRSGGALDPDHPIRCRELRVTTRVCHAWLVRCEELLLLLGGLLLATLLRRLLRRLLSHGAL